MEEKRLNPQTKEALFQMYWDYKHELWTYTGQNFEDELREWFEDMVCLPCMSVKLVKDAHTNTLIGFFAVQDLNREEQIESGCRWYISDAYVIPTRRGQRFMTGTVHEFIAQNKGNIGLVVIKNNIKAMKFWDDVFGGIGYTKERVYELGNGADYFYRFKEPLVK